nr:protein FATTY ACID EXPORT 4, chloroplastic-like isoform X1 [Ipomoea batatas]
MGCCSNVSFFSPLPTRPSLSHISSTITTLDSLRFPAQKTRLPSGTATTGLRCNCQLTTTDLAPLTSAAYGTLLFGGGLFACMPFAFLVSNLGIIVIFEPPKCVIGLQLQDLEVRAHFWAA